MLVLSAISSRILEKSVIGSSDSNECLLSSREQSVLKVVQSACLNFHRWGFILSLVSMDRNMMGKWSLPEQSSCTSHVKRSNNVGLANDKSIAEYVPWPEWRKKGDPLLKRQRSFCDIRLVRLVVLRRISDDGYITAPL